MKKFTTPMHAIFSILFLTTGLLSCDSALYFDVGGTVTGLDNATVVLQNNTKDHLTTSNNGKFTFAQAVVDGGAYDVVVSEQPEGFTCTVTNGTGEVDGGSVTNITVACVPPSPTTKIIFITTATTDGDIGGVAGADAFCMADAAIPNGSTYKAMINSTAVAGARQACDSTANCTDPAENVDWVMTPNTQYTRVDGTTPIGITNTAGIFDVTSSDLTNSYDGGPQVGFWVGVDPTWSFFMDCDGWTSNSNGDGASVAASDAVDDQAIAIAPTTCDVPFHLACVEQ